MSDLYGFIISKSNAVGYGVLCEVRVIFQLLVDKKKRSWPKSEMVPPTRKAEVQLRRMGERAARWAT